MLSFTGQQTQCQDLTQDTSAGALTFFKTNLNLGLHILEAELGSFYTEEEASVTTVAATRSYKTPANFIRLKKAYLTVSTQRYIMEEVTDEAEWQMYNQSTAPSSDTPTKIIVRRDNFEIYPKSTTAGYTITLLYEAGGDDLVADDYTTGTISTLSNGAK